MLDELCDQPVSRLYDDGESDSADKFVAPA